MTQQVINLGKAPSGVGGDTERSAFSKCNDNFNELYKSAPIERGANAKGEYTKFADGTLLTWGFQIVNAVTPAGQGSSWSAANNSNQPSHFSNQPNASLQYAFFTGANGKGDLLYGGIQYFPASTGGVTQVGINMGTKPATGHPSFTYGTITSNSYAVYFQCVGRWK